MIAVIDDGVNPDCYPQMIGSLCFDMEAGQHGRVVPRRKQCGAETHGTNCAAIIKKYAPDAPVGSICVFRQERAKSTPERLIAALRWCLAQEVRVINISIGFTPLAIPVELSEVITALLRKGTAVFAACSNKGLYTLPACMQGVFGVKMDPALCEAQIYRMPPAPFDVQIAASSRHVLEKGPDSAVMTGYGNSYGCALASALFWKHLQRGGTRESFLSTLEYREGVRQQTGMPEEVPVLAVEGLNGESLPVLRQICTALGKKSYRAAFFSRHAEAVENPAFHIPDRADVKEYLTQAAVKLRLSVVLTDEAAGCNGKLILNGNRYGFSEQTVTLPQTSGKWKVKAAVRRMIRMY